MIDINLNYNINDTILTKVGQALILKKLIDIQSMYQSQLQIL